MNLLPRCFSPRHLGFLVAALSAGVEPVLATAEAPVAAEPLPASPAPPLTHAPSVSDARRSIDAEVGSRIGVRVQNPDRTNRLDDLGMDGKVEVLLSGTINSLLKWQAGFAGTIGTVTEDGHSEVDGKAAVLDLIGRLEFHDAIKLWVGRMLVPVDRAGLSTEWHIAPWVFPGQFSALLPPVGARQGPFGRSDGATLWGNFFGGALKYYMGLYNLGDPGLSPLYSGRLSISLLDPEPGYRLVSSYYGTKDVLTLGVGIQHQIDGSVHINSLSNEADAWADFTECNVDLLFEKNLSSAGVLTLEGAFYKIWGPYEPARWTTFVLTSYLLPIEVGWGRFQFLFRLQRASHRGHDGSDTLGDAQLGYIMDGAKARIVLGYRYSKVSGQNGNALLVGWQFFAR